MKEFDIEQTVLRAQKGDEQAFVQLMKQYEKLVMFIALQRLKNNADAKDIVQETFIEVQRSIGALREPKFFKAWLNRIVLSKITRHYAKHFEEPMDIHENTQLHSISEKRRYLLPRQEQHFNSDKEVLMNCIRQLKPKYQEILLLRYFEELTMSELAIALQIPEGTVKTRLRTAKKELRDIIETLEDENGIKLDFQANTFQGLVGLAFADAYASMSMPLLPNTRLWKQLFHHPLLSASFMGGVLITSIGAYQMYQENRYKEPHVLLEPAKAQMDQQQPFPMTVYQNEKVDSAKDAYRIVFENRVNRESNEFQHLYDTLQVYGGAYANMAKHIMN